MNNSLVAEKVREIAENVAAQGQTELVHVEAVGGKRQPTIRIFIDKPEGVTIDDCAEFSRKVSAVLDTEDFISSAYVLEVSSPGIERGLYSIKDFEKFAGQNAKVKTDAPINGQKNFRGKIIGTDGDDVIFEDKTNGEVRFPFEAVAKANLEADFEEELKKH